MSPVGLTRDAGWELGVSRTLPLDADAAWALLLSPAGLAAWLGDDLAALPDAVGATYATAGGTTGELRSLHPGDRVRVTWRPPGRDAPATLQAVVRPAARGASIRLHAERLAGPDEREALRDRWRAALAALAP
jgi:uncharacterized protein YndB with AHSA1/START domain